MSATGDDKLPGARKRVLHFVNGGFSGATQVAIDLCLAARESPRVQALLVLRKRRKTTPARVQALRDQGLDVRVVPSWPRWWHIVWMAWLCRRWRAQMLLAHGFTEHLWGRYAGLLARVPVLVHVEHNSREDYTPWRLAQARWLARRTTRLVGVSEGVRQAMVGLGFPPDRMTVIPNGIGLDAFAAAQAQDFMQREQAVVMVARFAPQKDHPTLVRALALLADRGFEPPLRLAGAGNATRLREVEQLVVSSGLASQVGFLGQQSDVPALLMRHRICVLATHWEGMPLALVEGMAAGCACIASDVVGVHELIEHGVTGLLVPEGDAPALADAIERLLREPALAERLGIAARRRAVSEHGLVLMARRYEDLCLAL